MPEPFVPRPRGSRALDTRLVINRLISGCVRMACNTVSTSLLQIVNSWCKLIVETQNFLSTSLLQVFSTSGKKSANEKLQHT